MFKSLLAFGVVSVVALSQGACSKKKKNAGYSIEPELLRVAPTSSLRLAEGEASFAAAADQYPWTSDVELTELVLPIKAVTLSEFTVDSRIKNPVDIYTCESSCDVNLLGPELKNLLASKETNVKATGNFQQIAIGFGGMNWEGKIKGSFVLSGVRYYTKSDGKLSVNAPAELATYQASGGGSVSYLPEPLVLEEQSADTPKPLKVKLYFDPQYSVFGYDASKVPNVFLGGFCTGDSTEKRVQICAQRLVVSASLEAQPPTLERYLINDSSYLSVFFNSNGNPLGGYFKSYFREGFPYKGNVGGIDPTDPSYNGATMKSWSSGPIFGFTKNASGTYIVSNRIGEASPSNEDGGFKAKDFKRENHSDKYETSQGRLYDYTAKKL